jgi:hypothetical protein
MFLSNTSEIAFSLGGTETYRMLATQLRPAIDATSDLGASSLRYKDIYGSGFLAVGTTPATALGTIRLPNAGPIYARDAGNTANLRVITLHSDDQVYIGDGTTGAVNTSPIHIFKATTTAAASIRVPHGTAPTSPVNGDMWTTTSGLFVRINGVTVGPLS